MRHPRLAEFFDRPQRPDEEKSFQEQPIEVLREVEDFASPDNLADIGQLVKSVPGTALNVLGLRGIGSKTDLLSSAPETKPPTPGQKLLENSIDGEVSPEKENSPLFEELARRNFSAYEARCLFSMLAEGEVSSARVVEAIGVRRQHIARALKRLEKRRIIGKSRGKLGLNRCVEQWDVPLEVSPQEGMKPEEVPGESEEVQNGKGKICN